MIKYGLISEVDARCLEKTIDLIAESFLGEEISITEIGLFDCGTVNGVFDYAWKVHPNDFTRIHYTGIDSEKDKPVDAPYCIDYIKGDSSEVYYKLENNSQHLIFVDGCHCFAHVVSDFFCYAPKVKVGGFIAFHDTGKHIAQKKDFQHGDKDNPDAYISVRKALEAIGLFGLPKKTKPVGVRIDIDALQNVDMGSGKQMDIQDIIKLYGQTGYIHYKPQDEMFFYPGWQLIFDEADEANEAGGICVFKKVF